ncbi:MAG TPA: hypothetical protein VF171_02395, partial [Trueperaceae bacterium]
QQLHFEALVDQLVAEARRLDFNNEQILNRVATQLSRYPTGLKPVNVALVGLFEEATRAYAESLRRQLTNLARIEWFTFRDLEHQDARAQLDGYDLFVTFPHLLMTLKELVPDALVTDLGLLPSEHTRVSLAELDPRSRVLAISTFAEFLATLKKGISKFAPHLNDIHFVVLDESNPKELPAGCDLATYDVVVYATGSERIRELLPRTTRVFEYRHVPDSVFVDEQLAPILRKLRAGEPVNGPL